MDDVEAGRIRIFSLTQMRKAQGADSEQEDWKRFEEEENHIQGRNIPHSTSKYKSCETS